MNLPAEVKPKLVGIAEDDEPFLESLILAIESRGHEVLFAVGSFEEAEAALRGLTRALDVLLSDQNLARSGEGGPLVIIARDTGMVRKIGGISGADSGVPGVDKNIPKNNINAIIEFIERGPEE